MNIRIDLNDVPDFKDSLDIVISLKKDGRVETITSIPSTVPARVSAISPEPEKLLEKDNALGSVASDESANGSKNAKVESSLSSSKPIEAVESKQSESKPKPAAQKKSKDSGTKLSGNFMGMEF